MPQIYIAAIGVTVLVTIIYAVLFLRIPPKELRWPLLLLALFELPLQPLALYFVRRPLDGVLVSAMGKTALYHFVTVWYAPVTEELAKLLPVIVFFAFNRIDKANLRSWMLAIGFGFGIGEAWLIASRIAVVPEYAHFQWYEFGGFYFERILVCFIHGGMTGAGLLLSIGRGRWVLGTLLAMTLHFFGNAPIYLLGPLVWNVNPAIAAQIMTLWTLLYFAGAVLLLTRREEIKRWRRAQCPRCHAIYDRPLLAINLGTKRYEPCPECKTWNLTGPYKVEPNSDSAQ